MDGIQSFQYSRLTSPTGQIRLLRMLEDPESRFYRYCELHAFDIDETPEYAAISYTWGPIEPKRVINVNNAVFEVRENCWLALSQRGSLTSDAEWTWIDSICINQNDDDEKSDQVQMMADIYRRSACVLLSFPDPDERAGNLICSIAKAQTLAPRSDGGSPRSYQSQDFEYSHLWEDWAHYLEGDYLGGLGEAKELKTFVDGLLDFASQPYWSRVWVIQELMLAKHRRIMYGKHLIDWEAFMSVIRMAGDLTQVRYGNPTYNTVRRLDKAQLARLDDWSGLAMTNMLYHPTTERKLYSIMTDLTKILRFQCYDTRDRIYGLLAITDWSLASGSPKVDYRKSRLQLAVEVVELHRSVNISSSFSLESDILRVLELQSDYNSAEIQKCVELRGSRDWYCSDSLPGTCECPIALIPSITSPASKLTQGIIMSDDTGRLYLDTWGGWRLLLRLSNDKSAYVGYDLKPNTPSETQWNESQATAFFSPNLQVGDKVICPFHPDIPYMQRGNLVLRPTITGCSEVIGVGVFSWPEDRVPNYDDFTLDLLFDAEDVLLLMIVLLGGAHLDDWHEEDLHNAYKRLSRYRCRSRFSSFGALQDVTQRIEAQYNVPPVCAQCGGTLTGESRERLYKRYGMPP